MLTIMSSGRQTLAQKALNKWKSDGFIPLLQSIKWYLPYKFHKKARNSRIFAGERQFKIYTKARHQVQKVRYSAPADPWRPINIDPANIEYMAKPCKKEWGLGRIKGGNWDTPEELYPIEERRIVKGLRERYIDGKDWSDTTYVKEVKRKFANGKGKGNYQTEDEYLKVRCRFVDDLFESIKNEGYRPNFAAEHINPELDQRNDSRKSYHRLEPLVAIGRDGEIYWHDGFHRFTIAQILGIDSIPVNVIARHQGWQRIRDEIDAVQDPQELSSDIQSYISHPDLTDVVSESWL